MIRVVLPYQLQQLAKASRVVDLQVEDPVTEHTILDALEARYPMLRGAIRDQITRERRPFIRFFACGQDLSLDDPDSLMPAQVAHGLEKFIIVGAMAGG
jgi:molybdopterin synthase sulfur carrier subunit